MASVESQKYMGETACARIVILRIMVRLTQEHRNAIVIWATPVKSGGLGLSASEIQRRLKRVFKLCTTIDT